MTDTELEAIRDRMHALEGKSTHGGGYVNELWMTDELRQDIVQPLLAHIDFLRLLIHDLQEESSAYERGCQDGYRTGYERCRQVMEGAVEAARQDERQRMNEINRVIDATFTPRVPPSRSTME